jgi:ethanolamine utilization microcompartment shell protein EutS
MGRAFRDRASYKASDVAALFLASFIGTMVVCAILAVIEKLIQQVSH